ncbi:ABC transporter permease [Clostridiisalibacter paucivorans]|uniref:ABC transporter permease n=1 Tax=Clostridiisalibacter paucivorans TaxID=408753 RepID=UPI00047B4BA1|nr:iron ABC transporter permease [Clostridiisalibacter paucivorans]
MMIKTKRVSNLLGTHFYNILDKLILVAVISLVMTFILYPIASVIMESFIVDGKLTLDIYMNLFNKSTKLFYNSIFVAILTTVISTFMSVCISLYISFSGKRIRKVLLLVLMLTMISPPFVSSLAYITLFGRRGFIIHNILGLTMNTYGWQGIVAMQSLGFTSLSALILVGVINGIDKNFIKSSLDLGASSSYTVRKIVLPLMKPGILVVALLTFVRSLSDFGTPTIIGGAFNVLATQAYLDVIAYADLNAASAISVLIFVPAIIAFLFYRVFMARTNMASTNALVGFTEEDEMTIDDFLGKFIKIITYFFLTIMLLQYISIFVSAFTKYRSGNMYFSLENIQNMRIYSGKSFLRSILYALIAAIGGSLIGSLIAYYLEIRRIKIMKGIDFIATIPYIIPGTFFGIGYILAFNDYPLELTGTALIVIFNVLFKQLPMSTKINSAVLSQINPQIEQAAKDLGGQDFFVLKDIIIPMSRSALLVSFINNFTATMTTIGSIIFLIYPGKKLATIEMFDAIQSGNYGVGSAIAVTIILITLAVNITFSKFVLEGKNVFRN